MWRRLFRRDSIAGFVSILLAIASFLAQYILEGWSMQLEQWLSPLGVTFILLLLGGVSLVIWNFFRRDLTFDQKRNIVADRELYLPLLRDTVDKILSRKHELAIEAGRLSLEHYHEKYLRFNNSYSKAYRRITNKDETVKRKVAIFNALVDQNFHKRNPYLSELEHSPQDPLFSLQTDCDSYLSHCGDKGLNREVKELFKTANQYHLVLALAEMGLSNGLNLKEAKHYMNLYALATTSSDTQDLPDSISCRL